MNPAEVKVLALKVIENIAVPTFSNQIYTGLVNGIRVTQDITIKTQAIKTLFAISPRRHNTDLLNLLISELKNCRNAQLELLLLDLLSRYEYAKPEECNAVVEVILKRSFSDQGQVALALSRMPNIAGLLHALTIVKSSEWDRWDSSEGVEQKSHLGPYWIYQSRPHAIHDNRSAMIQRIEYQLAALHRNQKRFGAEVDRRYQKYRSDPKTNPEIQDLEQKFLLMERDHNRHLPVPIFFPEGTQLLRGLSTRHGKKLFSESLRDLIRKGCGSGALSDYELTSEGVSWQKVGFIFACHNKDLYFQPTSLYFSSTEEGEVVDSALILFSAKYYEEQYLKGEARMESEGTLNNVMYQGVPKNWIKCIYLPERIKPDIDLLVSETPVAEVKKQFKTEFFRDVTISEIKEFRRHLRSGSFYKRFRYFPNLPAEEIGKQIESEGNQFADEEGVKEATIKWAIARQYVRELYFFNRIRQD